MVAISVVTWSPLGLILTHHLHRQTQCTCTWTHTMHTQGRRAVKNHCHPEVLLLLKSYLWEAVVTLSLVRWKGLRWSDLMRLTKHPWKLLGVKENQMVTMKRPWEQEWSAPLLFIAQTRCEHKALFILQAWIIYLDLAMKYERQIPLKTL